LIDIMNKLLFEPLELRIECVGLIVDYEKCEPFEYLDCFVFCGKCSSDEKLSDVNGKKEKD